MFRSMRLDECLSLFYKLTLITGSELLNEYYKFIYARGIEDLCHSCTTRGWGEFGLSYDIFLRLLQPISLYSTQ